MTSEQPKVDTDGSSYTDIALEYVPTIAKAVALLLGIFMGIVTAQYLLTSIHLYVTPLPLFGTERMESVLSSNPNWLYPAGTVAAAFVGVIMFEWMGKVDEMVEKYEAGDEK